MSEEFDRVDVIALPFGTNGVVIDHGWAVALEFQDRSEIVRCCFGETGEAQGCGVLREREFLSGA